MITSFKKWWIYLSGFEQYSRMEHRMFNVVSLICFFTLIIIGLANYALGLPKVGNWTLLMVPLLATVYYLARFADRFTLASFLFASLSYVMMMGNYLLNSGINGPSVYGFLLTFLIIILITSPKTHILWFSLHVISVLGLYVFEASNPGFITYQYNDTYAQMADHILTYVPVLLFMYVAGVFLRKSYNSEKKLADERLKALNQQKEELEFTNKEKDRLFSIIGHDLRSPLNSIQGYLEILNSTDLSIEDRNEIQHQLHDLTTNTSHLLNNLLLWSSKTGSELQLNSIDLQEATKEVVNLIEPQAYKKGVDINCPLPTHDIIVNADKDMLQLVIRNILSNAVKFTPEKGNVNLWCEVNSHNISMYIQDTGIGIPENKKADIFTSRAKSTHGTAHESGIGLGLVLCQEFISAMGGSISFESTQNVGSTFIINLQKGN